MAKWFQVWNRQEYKEWALPKPYGYLLIIKRRQPNNFLLAKAKLIVKKTGLPIFATLDMVTFKSEKQADNKLREWKSKKN